MDLLSVLLEDFSKIQKIQSQNSILLQESEAKRVFLEWENKHLRDQLAKRGEDQNTSVPIKAVPKYPSQIPVYTGTQNNYEITKLQEDACQRANQIYLDMLYIRINAERCLRLLKQPDNIRSSMCVVWIKNNVDEISINSFDLSQSNGPTVPLVCTSTSHHSPSSSVLEFKGHDFILQCDLTSLRITHKDKINEKRVDMVFWESCANERAHKIQQICDKNEIIEWNISKSWMENTQFWNKIETHFIYME